MIAAILHHPKIQASQPLAAEIGEWLQEQGVEVWTGSTWDEERVVAQMTRLSLLVVLGGDGSLLRAARLSAAAEVPVFGVNMGKVGFLSEAQPDEWQEKLARVLHGDYWIERRLMLHAHLERNGTLRGTFVALNDVAVGRGKQARVVNFELCVDGDPVTSYTADALIVATPTGSTAYSLAAGGPILPPELQSFVVVPVAPHLSLDRALVLHEEAEISIEVTMDHESYVTPDGQDGISLASGDKVVIRKHKELCHFIRLESSGYFYRRLMERLGYRRET